MGLLIRALHAEITGDGAIIIELDPLCFLVEPTANGDVKIRYLPIVEDIAYGWLVERGLVVEDFLLQTVESVLVLLRGYGSIGLAIGDGLK